MARPILIPLLSVDPQESLAHLLEAAITDSSYNYMASRCTLPNEGDSLLLINRIRSLLNGYDFAVTLAIGQHNPEWLARSTQAVAAQGPSAAVFESQGYEAWKRRQQDPRSARHFPKLVCLVGDPDTYGGAQVAFNGAALHFVPEGFEKSNEHIQTIAKRIRATAGTSRSTWLRGI